MSNIAIRVENLSKAYRIGSAEKSHDTLMEAVSSFVRSPLTNFRNLRRLSHFDDIQETEKGDRQRKSPFRGPMFHPPHPVPAASADVFWALRNISFEVKHGEVLGIIGRNGAGKSTLLKIFSRITESTIGRAEIYGRVGSLLEVGTGFHPDLTGRENIYLNGTILGMKKREVDAKFEEIVNFSGVKKFIDTPVKRYSSGMRVRLGFSVAAHLEPDILIVDEVLAVGDIEFQKRCLGKMESVSKAGRTVLLVSHQMATISNLCTKTLLLHNGKLMQFGNTQEVVGRYLSNVQKDSSIAIRERTDRSGRGGIQFTDLRVYSRGSSVNEHLLSGEKVYMELYYEVTRCVVQPVFFVDICIGGTKIVNLNTRATGCELDRVVTSGSIICQIPRLPLAPGNYSISIAVSEGGLDILDRIENAASITVEQGDFYGTGDFSSGLWGRFLVDHSWEIGKIG